MSRSHTQDEEGKNSASSEVQSHRRFWQPYTITDPIKPCPYCGYSLVGLDDAASRCPECGRELTKSDRLACYSFRPVWESVRDVCVLPAVSASIVATMVFVAVLTDARAALMIAMMAGGFWLVSSGIMTLYIVVEGLRTFEFRRGRLRSEHSARLVYAAVGLLAVELVPLLACFMFFQLVRFR